ncbi:DEAD/DEAH box helicase [Exiguobacterium sp. s48]|uniref:DEAD/DEAH box helicase n=1 Tax=Exiguobacterium sp. s48 TaxID=2751273 RepID=UPI001BEA9AEC|nr:DEAD/DEAH box helicase [Exiguobacterium sp. s48]
MKPDQMSKKMLGVTRSKAKLYEYDVEEKYHIDIVNDPAALFSITIGILGEIAAHYNSESPNDEYLNELRLNLQFSAHFFDSYLNTHLSEELNNYLLLLGSASYYLCELPGSSKVLASHIDKTTLDLDASELDILLSWLLNGDFSVQLNTLEGIYGEIIKISTLLQIFFDSGNHENEIYNLLDSLRKKAYSMGTSRELLFADIISAVTKKKINNSTWKCLPYYSGISLDEWGPILKKKEFISELWPAQHLLGENNVFKGQSAVIQFPTSAGKTKAVEIIIRSRFLKQRTSLAVIIAPFKALCHEICNTLNNAFKDDNIHINELSDNLQIDFDISSIFRNEQIMVVTPEKLLYILRNIPQLSKRIDLLIYDEGHQFDNGTRGINYELLLASLKKMISKDTQQILISAVISNAEEVGIWLNGDNNKTIPGSNLSPTYRTVAFASWLDRLGRLEFVNTDNPEENEFFLPRIIEGQQLNLKGKETKERVFPEKSDSNSIALYLGLKLVPKGSIAIFCGKKTTASSLATKIIDAYNRGLILKHPIDFSDKEEVNKLHYLHTCHLGLNESITKCASIGIFTHHGSIPHGIRIAIEHAMSENLAKFVICTSTLTQGVNLPIRYLIVATLQQGSERIKVRDFHNLMGRVGRSGMHTEGSIIFSNPAIYDKRTVRNEKWRWEEVKKLLTIEESEPCGSSILTIFDPLLSDNKKVIHEIDFEKIIVTYFQNPSQIFSGLEEIANNKEGFSIENLSRQMYFKINTITGIESYLMTNWEESEMNEHEIIELAKETLAYSLANDEVKEKILTLFLIISNHISINVPENSKKKLFGKMLYGVKNSIEIETWTLQNLEILKKCSSIDEIIYTMWSLLSKNINNLTFIKVNPSDVLPEIVIGWLQGKSFADLHELLNTKEVKLKSKVRETNFKIEQVVELCENAFSYEGMLLVGAVAEIIENLPDDSNKNVHDELRILQKRLKYGLPTLQSIMFYELGFADRIVAQELGYLSNRLGFPNKRKNVLIDSLNKYSNEYKKILLKYPAYFTIVFNNLNK